MDKLALEMSNWNSDDISLKLQTEQTDFYSY